MTYLHQPNPEMTSPEYWDGIDVYDDDGFAGQEFLAVSPTAKVALATTVRLTDCLQEIAAGNYVETPSFMGERFWATPEQFADGSVVIIDSEQLRRQVTGPMVDVRPYSLYDSGPISEPFAEYWKQQDKQQAALTDMFGRDEMHFPEEVTYRRSLEWGVCVTGTTGSRILLTRDLFEPRTIRGEINIANDANTGRLMPFGIGTAQAYELQTSIASFQIAERVRGVNIVHHEFDSAAFTEACQPDLSLPQRLGRLIASKFS